MKKRIFALALALCMMLSVMPTSFAGNGFLTLDNGEREPSEPSGVLTDDSKTVPQSGVLTGASKYYRQNGILYNTGSQSGASYSLPSGTLNAPTGILTLDENVDSTTTLSGSGISAGTRSSALVTDDKNGLELSKKVTEKDGTYTITLEAYTTGKVITTEKATPLDVIFIIDQSGSMEYGMDGNENANDSDKRITIVKDMMIDFLNQTVTKTKDSSGDIVAHHRIAVVGFSSEYNNNNELLTGVTINNNNGAQFGSISQAEYAAALQDVSTPAGQQNVLNAINALTAKGGTQPTYGFEIAQNVFKYDDGVTGETNRQRVVIFLTDGEPDGIGWPMTGHEIAEKAVEAAYPLKGAYRATVYTIGIFEGADPTHIGVTGTAMMDVSKTDRANRFMNLASSNYPTANSFYLSIFGGLRWLAAVPERAEGDFYLSAINKEQLANIFTTVSEKINSANIDLGSTTEVRDAVSPYFDLPANASEIKLYTAAAKADGSFENRVQDPSEVKATISSDHKTVSVTGFDFNKNFVSDTAKTDGTYGKKLIIEFPIEPKTGFLGGNGVPTNDDANAGIYLNNGDLVENFPNGGASTYVPVADVTVDVTDKNIYLSETLDESGLLADATVKVGSVELDMTNTTTYGLEAWQYAYVTISTNVATNTGAKWTDDEVPFTLTCTVKTKDETVVKSDDDTAKVNVFKPVVTFQDSTIYLGTTPTYSNNYVDVVWKHGDTKASESMGAAPELTYSYSWLETAAPTDCTDVNVGVAIGQNDVTSHVTFTDTRTDENEFTVHVVKPVITSADITIYLSNTVDLNGQMTEEGNWVCGHTGSEQKSLPANNGETRLAPTIDYAFKVGDTPVSTPAAYRPLGCTEINVAATVNSKAAPISTNATTGKDYSTFWVHVLKPAFAVNCTDLWADYGTNVTLADHLNTTVTGWSDSPAGHTGIPTVTGSAPTVFTYTYEVKDVGATHMVTENDADFTVELAGFKIGDLDCGTRWSAVTVNKVDGADSDHNFTIHTNKFDLTIHKTWDGADVYKQDAIFTVSGGLGKFQVVLPAGQESITVKNLLCGQDYTVTEDSNWTWRWSDDGTKTVTTHKHGVTTDMPTSHIASEGATAETSVGNSVSFINTLVKQLWFDFCKLVQNIFGVGKGE